MVSYSKIARWLTFPIDPIMAEDWVANREVFGPAKNPDEREKELEAAYNLETIRGDKAGFFELGEILLAVPESFGEAWIYAKGVQKIDLHEEKVVTRIVESEKPLRIKIKMVKKPVMEWIGSGKKKIIFDLTK